MRRAQRHERELALVLLDLDGPADDGLVAEAARRLAVAVRTGEVVARVGETRFAWLLPETGGLNGWIAAERVRGSLAGVATLSAGVADLEDLAGAEELLALAEVAVDEARRSGGDATFRYSHELDAAV